MTPSSKKLVAASITFYVFIVAALVGVILVKEHGHFIYCLDDPYIHLALAENLAHGHYGINPIEFSSPSSSVVWPFLLIPFAGTALHAFVPLAWNLLFGSLTASLLGAIAARWSFRAPADTTSQASGPYARQYLVAALLLFVCNLPSLTILGMETVLQVLLAVCCAFGVIEVLHQRPLPAWVLAAAAIAPSVRYEDLALTLAIACVLLGLKRWETAAALVFGSVLPLVAFSAFLASKGLPLLPMSVLLKTGAMAGASPVAGFFHGLLIFVMFVLNGKDKFSAANMVFVTILLVFSARLAVRSTTGLARFCYGGAALLALLQMVVGRFGWFHRYEVYALAFLTIVALSVVAERPTVRFRYVVLALAMVAYSFVFATLVTPAASYSVYLQHYQMHRFTKDFYEGNGFAVNDLGLVSFERRPDTYVLDVYGLASAEAGRQQVKSAAWLSGIAQRYHANLAMLYPAWYEIPSSWTPLGKLCITARGPVTAAFRCVTFYSTSPSSTQDIRAEVTRFAPTLPNGVQYVAN